MVIWPGGYVRYFSHFGGNVIRSPIGGVAFQSESTNLPKEAGVELGESDVSGQSLAEHQAETEQGSASVAAGEQSNTQTNEPESPATAGSLSDHGGLIDYYI